MRVDENLDIRILIRGNGIPQYKVAEKMGITTRHLCRLLSAELSEKNRSKILSAIEALVEGN